MLRNCDVTLGSYEGGRPMSRVVARGDERSQSLQIARPDPDETHAVVAMYATGFLAREDHGAPEREGRASAGGYRQREVFALREAQLR